LQQPNWVANLITTIITYWVWIVVFFTAIIFIVILYLLYKKLQKKRIDPFADYYNRIKALCKFQRDPTIKEVYLVAENKLQHVGHYMGHCITQDGFMNIMFWKFKKWYLFWFPMKLDFFNLVKELMIIRANVNKEYKYITYDENKKQVKKIHTLANELVMRSGQNLMIRAVGLERVKYFLYPVLRDDKGNIIDSSLEIFEREKNPALVNVLYNLSEDFANISRELININPKVRYEIKTGEQLQKS
jgi:hypothetical protein